MSSESVSHLLGFCLEIDEIHAFYQRPLTARQNLASELAAFSSRKKKINSKHLLWDEK